jgi:outer membrane receptor for ferric coprogen and ferric-rhodotorulic acid
LPSPAANLLRKAAAAKPQIHQKAKTGSKKQDRREAGLL